MDDCDLVQDVIVSSQGFDEVLASLFKNDVVGHLQTKRMNDEDVGHLQNKRGRGTEYVENNFTKSGAFEYVLNDNLMVKTRKYEVKNGFNTCFGCKINKCGKKFIVCIPNEGVNAIVKESNCVHNHHLSAHIKDKVILPAKTKQFMFDVLKTTVSSPKQIVALAIRDHIIVDATQVSDFKSREKNEK